MTRPLPELLTARLRLCVLPPERGPDLLRYHVENAEHFRRWDPPHPPGFLSVGFWEGYLERAHRELERDQSLRLAVLDQARDAVVGTVNFTAFIRGPFQACLLGYGLDHRVQGQGLMTEALTAAMGYVFESLEMHRIMANYVPTNERSGRLLRRLGFAVEGYARDYLFIDGAWRDHVLTALTNPTPRPPGRSSAR